MPPLSIKPAPADPGAQAQEMMPAHCYECKHRFEIPLTGPRNATEKCPRCKSTRIIPHNVDPHPERARPQVVPLEIALLGLHVGRMRG